MVNDHDEPSLWLADPSVDWRILLAAELSRPIPADDAVTRLAQVNRRLTGSKDASVLIQVPDGPSSLLAAVVDAPGSQPIAAGLDGAWVAIAGEHRYVDGLGMLAVLSELTGLPARSAARGLGPRAKEPPFVLEVARRLAEVAVQPPALLASSVAVASPVVGHRSSYADLLLDRRVGMTELVHAATRAVVATNSRDGARARRIAVAIGASKLGGEAAKIADESALLRLRSAERADRAAIRHFLNTAATVPSPGQSLDGSASWLQRAAGLAVRILGPRLGSTLTISHLGDVTAEVKALSFYPIAGGASAVALGAVTLDGRTRITARGRGDRHSPDGLAQLLALVAELSS